MKTVTFKVAEAIKKAGYPQEKLTDKVYLVNGDKEGNLAHYTSALFYDSIVAPTYIEVWLWLWKEKKYSINVDCHIGGKWSTDMSMEDYPDQEEALIAAIDYLVDNDLIK